MKRISILRKCAAILAVVVSGAFVLEACAKEPSPLEGSGRITMTTKATSVRLGMEGTKDVTVDWGDGKVSDANDAFSEDNTFTFTHDYSEATAHNIVITGGNITKFYCSNNGLTALNVSQSTALTSLTCSNNQLTGLDVSKNTALHNLDCNYNQITSLDVSKNTVLWALYCIGNQLTTAALNDLFRTLPDHSEKDYNGGIFIAVRGAKPEVGNPGHAYCDRSIAEKKRWLFMTIK